MRTIKNIAFSLGLMAYALTASVAPLLAAEVGSPPVTVDAGLVQTAKAEIASRPLVRPGQHNTGADVPDAVFFTPADFIRFAHVYAPARAQSLATFLAYDAEPGVGWNWIGPGGQLGPFMLTRAQLATWGYTREQAMRDPVVQVRVHLASLKHLMDSVDLTPGQ
jgi:hypothetical protein